MREKQPQSRASRAAAGRKRKLHQLKTKINSGRYHVDNLTLLRALFMSR